MSAGSAAPAEVGAGCCAIKAPSIPNKTEPATKLRRVIVVVIGVATILSPLEALGPDLSACCRKYLQTKISLRLGRTLTFNSEKGVTLQMTMEQEQQLQNLDVEIQIAEKQLRVSEIKKQIAETELDVIALNHELQQRINQSMAIVAA
jgi:hypothetical protein